METFNYNGIFQAKLGYLKNAFQNKWWCGLFTFEGRIGIRAVQNVSSIFVECDEQWE